MTEHINAIIEHRRQKECISILLSLPYQLVVKLMMLPIFRYNSHCHTPSHIRCILCTPKHLISLSNAVSLMQLIRLHAVYNISH